jgi:hypothetical protein
VVRVRITSPSGVAVSFQVPPAGTSSPVSLRVVMVRIGSPTGAAVLPSRPSTGTSNSGRT